jgi:spermidine synthase
MPLDPKRYVRLLLNGNTMMTDADFERRANAVLIAHAKGDCVVAGLGIGLILDPLAKLCGSVTVVEISQDVIDLVAAHYSGVKIIQGDINTWRPEAGQKYDMIYLNTWPDFNTDIAADGQAVAKQFRKYLRKGGWIGNWAQIACPYRGLR